MSSRLIVERWICGTQTLPPTPCAISRAVLNSKVARLHEVHSVLCSTAQNYSSTIDSLPACLESMQQLWVVEEFNSRCDLAQRTEESPLRSRRHVNRVLRWKRASASGWAATGVLSPYSKTWPAGNTSRRKKCARAAAALASWLNDGGDHSTNRSPLISQANLYKNNLWSFSVRRFPCWNSSTALCSSQHFTSWH